MSGLPAFNASRFTIRSARAVDAKACRMLLPDMPADSLALAAFDGAQGLIIGAAAMTESQRMLPVPGPGIWVHVVEPCRQQGVGRALCAAVAALAASRGAQAVYAARRVNMGSPEIAAWQSLGFDICETVEEHELPLRQIIAKLAPLMDQLTQRKWIPADARVAPLYEADKAQVLQLHLDLLGGDRQSLIRRIRGQSAGAFHPRYSQVLLVGEQVAGFILAHRHASDAAIVDAHVIAPNFRFGWATVWLRLEAALAARALGIERLCFTTFDHYADTRAVARKLGAATTSRSALMYRTL